MLTPPLAAPAIPVTSSRDVADRWRGGPAVGGAVGRGQEVAESLAADVDVTLAAGLPLAVVGGCSVLPLPLDATCAKHARQAFRDVAQPLGLADGLAYDAMTMASELAANTLHAQGNVEFDGVGQWPVAGGPEMWMYLRRFVGRWELVCKFFDSLTGWKGGRAPEIGESGPDGQGGRGLQVVAGLSGGRWGHHLTRSRLGGWKVPGKAVWFAIAAPGPFVPGQLRGWPSPCHSARRLEAMLADRAVGARLLRVDERGASMSVLSVRSGLTVWCAGGALWWRSGGGGYERRGADDLEEVAELLVCRCEEMDAAGQRP